MSRRVFSFDKYATDCIFLYNFGYQEAQSKSKFNYINYAAYINHILKNVFKV